MPLFGSARGYTPTLNALAQYAPITGRPNALAQQQARTWHQTPADRARGLFGRALQATGQLPGEARATAENVVGFSPLGVADDLNSGAMQTGRGVAHGSKGETLGGILAMTLAGAPIRGPVKREAKGLLEEFMRDGSDRFLTYKGANGHVANMHVAVGPDGLAEISIDPFLKEPNRFGIGAVRDASEQLRALYPEITGFTGERLTGANPGRVQTVKMK